MAAAVGKLTSPLTQCRMSDISDTEVLNDPRVYESEIYCKLGDMIPEVTSSLCRSGHIIVTEDTPQNAIELAERLIRKVIIVTK